MQIQQEEIAQLKAQLEEQKKLGNQLNDEKEKAIHNVDQYKSLYMVSFGLLQTSNLYSSTQFSMLLFKSVVKKLESQNSPPSHLGDPTGSAASNDKYNISFLRQEIAKRDAQLK